ncbi:MAG TPA: DMT family transporter [Burkholderiaceae bacterium]|nr:DMT family transporter [Burkholderiaceae bacterium]
MRTRDLLELVTLAALWGASFLFMRHAAPAFGPIALVQVRVSVAAAILTGLLLLQAERRALRTHVAALAFVGVMNSALPFVLFTYATLYVTAGFAAILNATTPLWTALVGRLWLRDRIRPAQWIGLGIGALGVAALLWGKVDLRPGSTGWQVTLAIGAALLGAAAYGTSATFARKRLGGVPALVVATGSQIAAAIVVLPFATAAWPGHSPPLDAWASAIALAVACTALAYLLYFRLIAHVGAVRAAAVTFLIPVFATCWGSAFLAEDVTLQMLAGGCVILAGTALALGLVGLPRVQRSRSSSSRAEGERSRPASGRDSSSLRSSE